MALTYRSLEMHERNLH